MSQEATRDITLRTLAGDTAAIGKNAQPEAEHITLHPRDSSPTPAQETYQPLPEIHKAKKRSPIVSAVIVLFALAALGVAGYLLYTNLTTPVRPV